MKQITDWLRWGALRARKAWKSFPEQVKRLTVIFVAVVVALAASRILFVPSDFGKYGHYRASAAEENAAYPVKYAGRQACGDCHEEQTKALPAGYHHNLSCEVCHGPGAAHIEAGGGAPMLLRRDRVSCPLCHEFSPSRPTGFPQIVSASHNPLKPCAECHNPHDPTPPHTPRECSACHAEIWRTKAVSHHTNISCGRCHRTKPEHFIEPRRHLPSTPMDREFCGECHSKAKAAAAGAPAVDMSAHEPRYVCWQCHYPHMPEAR